ncbi:MAG: hypothetical protein K8R21_04970, partial [Leptospira sp.]|nr:hypothetical protein [Leptospira sp.]
MHAKIAIIAFLILLNFSLTGQGTKEDKSSSGEGKETSDELNKKNIGNYLEKYHQTVLSENLKTRNLYNIHVLDIIVNNFGDQISGVKEELESIKKDYQVALRYYYRRAYMLSGPKMKENDRKIGDLFKKISNFYEAKSDNLLTECADAIVTVEQNETIEPGNEKNSRFRELSANQLRLKIAYY